jgi:hypothetical protein
MKTGLARILQSASRRAAFFLFGDRIRVGTRNRGSRKEKVRYLADFDDLALLKSVTAKVGYKFFMSISRRYNRFL